MNFRAWSAPILLAPTAFVVIAPLAFAQRTLSQQTPASATRDSNGDLRKDDSQAATKILASGSVVFADGSTPEELVEIYGGCGGAERFIAVADSKGRVSFNPKVLAGNASACVVHASLDGFRSASKTVDANSKSSVKFGQIVLQPLSSDLAGTFSNSARQTGKAPKKMHEKALDQAAAQEWSNAIATLTKAVATYPDYSSAWLSLGVMQQSIGDYVDAKKSFLEAVRADPKFALPYIRAAGKDAAEGDWEAALVHSQQAIDLNRAAFPNAYALNAMANVSLQNVDAAEKSAREGMRLDADHQYPELEYSLGIVLYSKGEKESAKKLLESYVSRSPSGPNATVARNQLVQMHADGNAAMALASADNSQAQPREPVPTIPLEASARLRLRDRNAPLLMKTASYTCLESVSRGQIDMRGRLHGTEAMRIEIAISDGKEIYGEADGKRFSSEKLSDILGFSFSTSGLFSSIARAVIAGNQVDIQAAGEQTLSGEAVLRYNFHALPGAAGWSIQYGKESGHAGAAGWFYVDRTSLTLRRVVVQAADVPRNLKLKSLRAVIDYESETIAEHPVLLPETAEVTLEEKSGTQRVSRIFFNHCRAFQAESALSFEVDSTGAQNDRPTGKPGLPPDMDITVALVSPIRSKIADGGDVITAQIAQPVTVRGHELIRRGATVEGHVRPRRGENGVVIEFDRVQTRDGWAPFYARLVALGTGTEARIDADARQQLPGKSRDDARVADPEIPGVAKISFAASSTELRAGTQMLWKTELLAKPAEVHAPDLSTAVSLR